MTKSRAPRATWTAKAAPYALAIVAACGLDLLTARPAAAQSEDEKRVARELFQDAYKDEQQKRYTEALEKFQRVARVKETAAVRYRIANVLDALGRLREARDTFRAIAATKASLPTPAEQEIADSAAERAHQLDARIPRLVLRLDPKWPDGTRVAIDGAAVPASAAPRAIELDPGEHVIAATAPARGQPLSFEGRAVLGERGDVSFVVPPPAGAPSDGVVATVGARPSGERPGDEPPPSSKRTLGYVLMGTGGAFALSSIVMLVVRENDIAELSRSCVGNVCPTSRQTELESTHDEAALLGPLAATFGIVGLAAIGVGAYFSFRREAPPATASPAALLAPSMRVVPVRGGGGGVTLSASFW